jgi:hypothetical protein
MSDRSDLAAMFNRWISPLVLILGLGSMTYVLLVPPPRLPSKIANGRYSNPCCGTIELRDGRMEVNHQFVSYVIETDKVGAYVLTEGYVGMSTANKIEIDHRRYPLKIGLNSPSKPTELQVSGDRTVRFTRVQ